MALDAIVYTKNIEAMENYLVRQEKNLSQDFAGSNKFAKDLDVLEKETKRLYEKVFVGNFSGTMADYDNTLTALLNQEDEKLDLFLSASATKIWEEWQLIEKATMPQEFFDFFNQTLIEANTTFVEDEVPKELEKVFGSDWLRLVYYTRGTAAGYKQTNKQEKLVDLIMGLYSSIKKQLNTSLNSVYDSITRNLKELYEKLTKKTNIRNKFEEYTSAYITSNQAANGLMRSRYVNRLANAITVTINKNIPPNQSSINLRNTPTIYQNFQIQTNSTLNINGLSDDQALEAMRQEYVKISLKKHLNLAQQQRLDQAISIFSGPNKKLNIRESRTEFVGDIGEIGVIYRLLNIVKPQYVSFIEGNVSANTPGIDILMNIPGSQFGIQVKNWSPNAIVPRNFRKTSLENQIINDKQSKKYIQAAVNLITADFFNVEYKNGYELNKDGKRVQVFKHKENLKFKPLREKLPMFREVAENFLQRFFPEAMSIKTLESGLQNTQASYIFVVAGRIISAAQIVRLAYEQAEARKNSSDLDFSNAGKVEIQTPGSDKLTTIPDVLNMYKNDHTLKTWRTQKVAKYIYKNAVVITTSYDFSDFFKI